MVPNEDGAALCKQRQLGKALNLKDFHRQVLNPLFKGPIVNYVPGGGGGGGFQKSAVFQN